MARQTSDRQTDDRQRERTSADRGPELMARARRAVLGEVGEWYRQMLAVATGRRIVAGECFERFARFLTEAGTADMRQVLRYVATAAGFLGAATPFGPTVLKIVAPGLPDRFAGDPDDVARAVRRLDDEYQEALGAARHDHDALTRAATRAATVDEVLAVSAALPPVPRVPDGPEVDLELLEVLARSRAFQARHADRERRRRERPRREGRGAGRAAGWSRQVW